MSPPQPPPLPPAPAPAPLPQPPALGPAPPLAPRVALAVCAVALIGLLAVRGYGNRLGARPTEFHPAAVARQVDLNSADKTELLQIPGVGPVLADAILTHRRGAGRFSKVDELGAVRGIGGKTLDKLRPWVTVADAPAVESDEPAERPVEVERLERKPVPKPQPVATPPAAPAPTSSSSGKLQPGDPPLDLNAVDPSEFQRLPGIGPAMAQRIAAARAERPFAAVNDLRRVRGIGPKTLEALRPYVTVAAK
ncbi:ComEA family DNA-binding protein [Fimbriiglobus ruber]|uniref:Late competence protein ComEA, DNA receptor n=1 Tax=Fimbriiglobus ruber TaxID=1908690 RepID=A0A225DUE7_9BACT|nr:helix-hairpin-helix domain-containing protein [Fimbriiglobus ruber]OWK45140.1 Late competence protein ComEA, DNA receptor [Fimbriiglobus ruber]